LVPEVGRDLGIACAGIEHPHNRRGDFLQIHGRARPAGHKQFLRTSTPTTVFVRDH
jgi:hypothetical protein